MHIHTKFYLPGEAKCNFREDARKIFAAALDLHPTLAQELLWHRDGRPRPTTNPYVITDGDRGHSVSVYVYGESRCTWWIENCNAIDAALREYFKVKFLNQSRDMGEFGVEASRMPVEYVVRRHIYNTKTKDEITAASKEKKRCDLIDQVAADNLTRSFDANLALVDADMPEDFALLRVSATPLPPVPCKAGRINMAAETRFVTNFKLVGPWFVGSLRGRGFGHVISTGRPTL